jgi:predicted nucleic acid-binding Zn ribbon protein
MNSNARCAIALMAINRDINADGDIAAPNCSKCGLTMERIYSISGITFKGIGWGKDA